MSPGELCLLDDDAIVSTFDAIPVGGHAEGPLAGSRLLKITAGVIDITAGAACIHVRQFARVAQKCDSIHRCADVCDRSGQGKIDVACKNFGCIPTEM